MSKEFTPVFHNDAGVKEIEIGVRHFGCMGQTPPMDHPHVFLEVPASGVAKCPYCATLYRYNPDLAEDETRPAGAIARDDATA